MEMPVKLVLMAWESQNNNFTKLLGELSNDQLAKEIAPGKNTGTYLLGHLVAVSDGMLPLLGFGEKLFPGMEIAFLANPDKSGQEMPPIDELRKRLITVNEKLNAGIQATSSAQWLERHTAVSAEAFEKEQHRNKLNIIINRTNHMCYHLGQIALLNSSLGSE